MLTELIYDGIHYTACTMKESNGTLSLIVQSKRKRGGLIIRAPQSKGLIELINDAWDKQEGDYFCKSILNDAA
jgi:hypothetical protein